MMDGHAKESAISDHSWFQALRWLEYGMSVFASLPPKDSL
jgi:hypothetical protein